MKKVVIALLVCCFTLPALAMQELQAPSWDEFCPDKYLHSKYEQHTIWCNDLLGRLLTVSLFGSPLGVPMLIKHKARTSNNYWAKRRIKFENDIKTCNYLSTNDGKINCYMQARQNQYAIENKPEINVYNTNNNNN